VLQIIIPYQVIDHINRYFSLTTVYYAKGLAKLKTILITQQVIK